LALPPLPRSLSLSLSLALSLSLSLSLCQVRQQIRALVEKITKFRAYGEGGHDPYSDGRDIPFEAFYEEAEAEATGI